MLSTKPQTDGGVSAILVAMALLVLMGFAAIAVDYGLGINERRQDQTAADNAALAAGVEMIVSGDGQAAVDAIKTYTTDNLGRPVSDADWESPNCVDPNQLELTAEELGYAPDVECISFGPSASGIAFRRIRVRIPDQTTDSVFSQLLGASGLVTAAAAEVELDSTLASGAFPAGVFLGAGAGQEFCIKSSTGPAPPNSAQCGTSTTGDFGNFKPYFYTEVAPGNPSSQCSDGNAPAALARAMADGMDHDLGTTPTAPGSRVNGASCPGTAGPPFPNQLDSGGGYSNNDITNGLVKGGTYDGAYSGRLTRKTWPSYGTASIFGEEIDNRPLWTYIDTAVVDPTLHPLCDVAASGPDSNDGTNEAEFIAAQTAMKSCLASGNVPFDLFVDELYESPRLTIVPEYHQLAPLPSNACCYDVKDFVPVFIEALWTANGNQWTCDGTMINDTVDNFCKHEPGRTGQINIGASGQQKIDSASAIVLSCEVLPGVDDPEQKCRKVGSGGAVVDIFLNLFLVK